MKRLTTTCRALALCLLAGLGAQQHLTSRTVGGTAHYFAQIRSAGDGVPGHIGPWVGQDVPVPVQSLSMLKPNLILSRRYLDVADGNWAGFVLIHCSDAHDMAGHFPLRCYPAQGWELLGTVPCTWTSGDLQLSGMEYEFTRFDLETHGRRMIVVDNCLLRPGGQVFADMNALAGSIGGAGGELTGAGQIQIYFDASVPKEKREAAVATLLAGYGRVIDAILASPGS